MSEGGPRVLIIGTIASKKKTGHEEEETKQRIEQACHTANLHWTGVSANGFCVDQYL